MQKEDVMRNFALLADLPFPERYEELTEQAVQTVSAQMKPDADPEDGRLIMLAAAEANLQYRRMILARRSEIPGYAGTARGRDTASLCRTAEELRNTYRASAAPLLRDDAFVFRRAGDGLAQS